MYSTMDGNKVYTCTVHWMVPQGVHMYSTLDGNKVYTCAVHWMVSLCLPVYPVC